MVGRKQVLRHKTPMKLAKQLKVVINFRFGQINS